MARTQRLAWASIALGLLIAIPGLLRLLGGEQRAFGLVVAGIMLATLVGAGVGAGVARAQRHAPRQHQEALPGVGVIDRRDEASALRARRVRILVALAALLLLVPVVFIALVAGLGLTGDTAALVGTAFSVGIGIPVVLLSGGIGARRRR
jgi:predicted lysophospholipase L1 biosynthesis ABC-type transport system permease subunit